MSEESLKKKLIDEYAEGIIYKNLAGIV